MGLTTVIFSLLKPLLGILSMQKDGLIGMNGESLDFGPIAPKAEGYFTSNNNGFFGVDRPDEILYFFLEDEAWQALKIVGDRNVPRGEICFKTYKIDIGANVTDFMEAKQRGRYDIEDANGFTWGWNISMRFDEAADEWIVLRDGVTSTFTRCQKMVAKEGARNPDYL